MEVKNIISQKEEKLENLSPEQILKIVKENPMRVLEIKSNQRSYAMCEIIVKTGGRKLLKAIPKNMWDENLYFLLAVHKPFYIFCHIPDRIKTKAFFEKVLKYKIENNIFDISCYRDGTVVLGDAYLLLAAPDELFTRDVFLQMVRCNGLLLGLVPENFKDYEICDTALKNKWLAVKYLPERFFSEEFIGRLISCNGLFLKYVPMSKRTIEICCRAIAKNIAAREYIPVEFNSAPQIMDAIKLIENKKQGGLEIDKGFSFYERTIESWKDLILVGENNQENCQIIKESNKRKVTIGKKQKNNFKVYYITDLHLNHKLLKKFPTAVSKEEIVEYIKELINQMFFDINIWDINYLLIGGDVSFSFEISQIFYTELSKIIMPKKVVAILGNHELWNYNRFANPVNEKNSLEETVGLYRGMFNQLGINFLQNDLLVTNFDISEWSDGAKEISIIPSWRILEMKDEEICDICKKSPLTILGGIGFSGYNERYNVSVGLYRETITNKEQELKCSKEFERLHNRLSGALYNKNLIVFTHMPKRDWTRMPYLKNWVYVSGHTHNNTYIFNKNQMCYEDNQMGYYWEKLHLRYFLMGSGYNIFEFLCDGIYEISRKQYLEFNLGIGIHCDLWRVEGRVLMCKREKYYLFLLENHSNGRLYLLNGGRQSRLKIQTVEYYYENMIDFCLILKKETASYRKALRQISKDIQKIGGTGTIHGSIVDIDFFNHIYLNPIDGTIHAYNSPVFGVQKNYDTVLALLKAQCPDYYLEYKKLIKENNKKRRNGQEIIKGEKISFEKEAYKQSYIVKKIEYITENNIIRLWDDEVLRLKNIKK